MSDRDSFDTLTPEFRVQIDGAELPEAMRADLQAIRVLDDVSATSMFSVTVSCWNTTEMKVKWIDDSMLDAGKVLSIYMGYRDKIEAMITGEISGLEPEFHSQQAPSLTIRGYGRGHRLMRQRRTKSFLQMKDSDIAQQIASTAGLKAEVEDTGVRLDYVLQHSQTDLEFLQQRAARIGYEVFITDTTLHFRKPALTGGGNAPKLHREIELLEFYPRSTTLDQVEQVAVRGWDFKQKQPVQAKADTGSVNRTLGSDSGPSAVRKAFPGSGNLGVLSPVASVQEADALARGLLNETALMHVTAEGLCIGRMDLRAGTIVNIEGVGKRFGGSYYLTSTEHTFLPHRGYRTSFTARRNATG